MCFVLELVLTKKRKTQVKSSSDESNFEIEYAESGDSYVEDEDGESEADYQRLTSQYDQKSNGHLSKGLSKRRRTRSRECDTDSDMDVPLNTLSSKKIRRIGQKKYISKGCYVIVMYENEYFPGKVEDENKNQYEVSTMVLSTGNTFRWPEKTDKIWYNINQDDDERSPPPTPDAPPYSPITSPEGSDRARSRSPIWHQPSESAPRVIAIFSEDGTPLEAEHIEEREEDTTFLATDAHTIFVSPRERGRSGRRSGRRGGRRGDRGGRVRNVRGRGQGRRGPQWEVGHPLNEIWVTDDDVPDELRNMVMDVIHRRMQGRDRNRPERGTESESDDDGEFFDADGCSRDFEWTSMESFQGKEETFLPAVTGSTQEYNSAYDAFRSYWDDDILGLIVSETNQYASKIAFSSFQADWYATNIHPMDFQQRDVARDEKMENFIIQVGMDTSDDVRTTENETSDEGRREISVVEYFDYDVPGEGPSTSKSQIIINL
ncbi:unnamed protein product [Colias eurytheme]|nr:unnamed protein product [Colias eurytheme]